MPLMMQESRQDGTTAQKVRKLHDVTREMMAAESREAVFDVATEAATALLGFRYNTIRKYDEKRDLLVPVAASKPLRERQGERRPYGRGESIQWVALEAGRMQVFQDVTTIEDDADRSGEGSMMVVPLDRYGVLTMGSPTRENVTDADIELARVFGANLETAIDRVNTLEERRRREERLRQKNERLDRFSGMVAHEFRNSLNVVSGHLDLVEGTKSDEAHLKTAKQAVDRMDRLTESLLDLVQSDSLGGSVEPVELGDLAREIFAELCPASATLIIEEEGMVVVSNQKRLRTLLENLLDNAVTHGGTDVCIWVGATEEGFYVADDGPGFEYENIEKLFSYRPSNGTTQSGLGLAIVRDIARAHDWEVAIDESREEGARIEFSTETA